MATVASPSVTRTVVAAIEQERAAVVAGDLEAYLATLTGDAVFLPPNSDARSGAELRTWLGSFLRDYEVKWLSFASTEVTVAGDLAYHTFVFTWRVTPRAEGESRVQSGKGLHILRRQPDGAWKIAREIWNSVPS